MAREARAARNELQRLNRETTTTQADYVAGQQDVKQATDDSTKSHSVYERVLRKVGDTAKDTTDQTHSLTSAVKSHRTETDRDVASITDQAQAISSATAALGRFNRVHSQTRHETIETRVETDRLGRSLQGGSRDGNVFTRVLGAMGGAMGKVRLQARNFGYLLGQLKIPAIVAGITALTGAISGLVAGLAALIPRLAQVTTIMAGLPGLLVGVVQGVGVSILGFKGLGDAVKALSDRQAAAGDIQQAQADSLSAVADAEEALADSQDSVRDAQEALTQAREDAVEALQDMRFAAEAARLGEEGAEIGLIQARRNLRELQAGTGEAAPTDLDLRSAVLDVQQAELGLKVSREDSQRANEDLRESERKGIEQSDQLVAAREALTAATEAAADSQQALADAMTEAGQGAGGLTSEQEKMRQAFKDLTPEARAFARQLFSMRDLITELRQTAQRGILPGASQALQRLTTLFPEVQDMVGSTSRILGNTFQRLASQITSPVWQRDLPRIFEMGNNTLLQFADGFSHFLDLMRNFLLAAAPLTDWLGDITVGFLKWADAQVAAGRESGRLEAFFQRATDAAEQLGRIIEDVSVAIFNVFEAGADVGQDLWDGIERGAEAFRDFTESIEGQDALFRWFDNAQPVMEEVWKLIKAIGRAFVDLAGDTEAGIAPLLEQVRQELLPALVELGESVSAAFGPQLIDALTNIAELFAVFGGHTGTFVVFLDIINTFADALEFLIEKVPGIKQLLSALFIGQGVYLAWKLLGSALGAAVKPIQAIAGIGKGISTVALKLADVGGAAGKAAPALFKVGTGLSSISSGWVTLAVAAAAILVWAALAKDRFDDLGQKAADLGDALVELGGTARLTQKALRDLGENEELGPLFEELIQDAGAVGISLADGLEVARIEGGEQIAGLSEDIENMPQVGAGVFEAEGIGTETFDAINDAVQRIGPTGRDVGRILHQTFTDEEIQSYYASLRAGARSTNPELAESSGRLLELINLSGGLAQADRDLDAAANARVDTFQSESAALDELARKYGVPVDFIVDKLGEVGLTAEEALAQHDQSWAEAVGIVEDSVNIAGAMVTGFNDVVAKNRDVIGDYLDQTGESFRSWSKRGATAFAEGGAAAKEFTDEIRTNLANWRADIEDGFDAVGNVLSEFSGDVEVSAGDVLGAFEDQLDILSDYQDNWEELKDRNVPQFVLDQIGAMGLEGAGLLAGLADANDEEFDRIISKWRDTKKDSADLGDQVADDLVPALDDLVRVLKNLPDKIMIALGLDTTDAREETNAMLRKWERQGIVITPGHRQLAAHDTGHTGGPAEHLSGVSFGPPKSDEVDARLQKGEYVMSREAVKGAGGMHVVDRMHQRFKRKKFHSGGGIGPHSHVDEGDNIDDLATRVNDIRNLSVTWVMPTPKLQAAGAAMPTGPLAGAGAGGMTPNATYAARILRTVFPEGLSMSGTSIRSISGTSTWSQHAFSNAWDIFSPVKQAIADFLHANASVLKVAELIYNHQDSWRGGAWGPYTGTSNPHTDHVHVDFWPWYTGDPYTGGHPVGYAKGGKVRQRRGMVHKDEFVLQRKAANALGEPALNFLNTNAGQTGPAAFLEAFNQSFAAQSIPRMGGGLGMGDGGGRALFNVSMVLDGKTVSRSVDVHSREARILLPGR